jgi:UDP-N-acetylglucosamine--N-acetylmuramyl-(pentapeptide) pyrophosphoryl-undecaprenol N-acetylglucosamine transferase
MNTIVIAAGGTGGHLYPAIAVAEEIRIERPETRVVFIGTRERIESREVPRAGFEFFPIDIAAPGRKPAQLARFPFQYVKAVRRSRDIFNDVKPCAFLGGGAYLSVPVAQAAKQRKVPIALLEINAVAGRANKILSRSASKIFLAYEESQVDFDSSSRKKIEVIGTPVRSSLGSETISKEEARKRFGLDPSRRTLLVFGGSLGARSLNEAMARSAEKFVSHGLNVIWQTGNTANIEELKRLVKDGEHMAILPYINEMGVAYAAADLVVSRSGASTLAELATLGKAAILVPYPFAIKNHQEHNARSFERASAAHVILDAELEYKFEHEVLSLINDEAALVSLQANIRLRENMNARKVVAQYLTGFCS